MTVTASEPDINLTPIEGRLAGGLALPPVPRSVEELGVGRAIIEDLALRRAKLDGYTSTLALAEALCVSPALMEEVVVGLRALMLVEVQGLEGRNLLFTLTDEGARQAEERLRLQRYAGPAPVPLPLYSSVVTAQQVPIDIDREAMRKAFADLVISDALLDELGPAARSSGAMFLYGRAGTGKSAIAERLIRIHEDLILVPYAVEVDRQIVLVFDPVVHRPCPVQPLGMDRRWVVCERPCIIAGGELTADELDLAYESSGGVYLAPLQMQANNGILVIDDLGRQALSPEALLNRWIVPLDRGVDYLTLSYGLKFEVPCTSKIVFSTNLEPASLGDEAFFRRIRSKVLIPPLQDDQFDEVLRLVAKAKGVTVGEGAGEYLRWMSRNRGDGDLRAYLPGAVCDLVESICGYEHAPLLLDKGMVDRVTKLYFTQAAATGSQLADEDLAFVAGDAGVRVA